MRSETGFSLIELLIVVAIIIIIASIAIPNLLRARIAANEASAVGSLQAINTAQIMYQSAYPRAGYADVLSKLGPVGETCNVPSETAACLIDNSLAMASEASRAKNGYFFAIITERSGTMAETIARYTTGASASAFNQTGVRDFCSTEDGVVRTQTPNSQSQPSQAAQTCREWHSV